MCHRTAPRGWLTATSANRSGEPDANEVSHIADPVREAVDLVVDLGRTPGGLPSTVVEWSGGQLKIIREGAVSANRLIAACGPTRETRGPARE